MVSKIIQHKVILYPVFFFILNCNTSMYAFMYVRMRSSVPTPMKYLDLVGAYVCMYVCACVYVTKQKCSSVPTSQM